MNLAEQISTVERLSWIEICHRHPDEWVCLLDVDRDFDGAILSARVIAHDRSMKLVLAKIGDTQRTIVIQTAGRRLRFPRIEVTDEIRDIVRPSR